MSAAVSSARFQKGATLWGMLGVIAIILFFSMLIIKIVPSYIENQKFQKALDNLAEDQNAVRMNRYQMIKSLTNRLYIDMADETLDLGEAFTITKTRDARVLTISYEKVIPMAYNISVLLDFENVAEIPLK
jgi:Tfp pilus assembly major pilin PilA